MRFIHTADWHLGRLFHGVHLTDDQHHVLAGQFIDLVRDTKPDAVIVAGDIYDRAVPPPDAVELLDEVLSRLVLDIGVPVILIAGNHDSPGRLSFGSRLLAGNKLYVTGCVSGDCRPVILSDGDGPVAFYSLPYAEPSAVRQCLGCDQTLDHHQAMRKLTDVIRGTAKRAARSVAIAHAFVAGGAECESERPLSVGGAGTVDASVFDGFNYTALGHLHCPQEIRGQESGIRSQEAEGRSQEAGSSGNAVSPSEIQDLKSQISNGGARHQPNGGGVIRYSGSLLKYSFDESDSVKSAYIIDMNGDGDCTCESVPFSPRRDVRRIEGRMGDLLKGPADGKSKDDYLEVMLLDDGPVLDAIGKLREVYPNVLSIRRPASVAGPGAGDRPDVRGMSEVALFRSFFSHVCGNELSADQEKVFVGVMVDLHRREREGADTDTPRTVQVKSTPITRPGVEKVEIG